MTGYFSLQVTAQYLIIRKLDRAAWYRFSGMHVKSDERSCILHLAYRRTL